jgi:inorganic pyrophosphatase/exopolyphosphatase
MGFVIPLYLRPDLDAFACAISYSDFLNKKGKKAKVCLDGKINRETQFVLDYFGINRTLSEMGNDLKSSKIILVDVSSPEGISPLIDKNEVVEVIDHRRYNKTNAFPNAKIQVELVGSCATLIAEKYKSEDIEISKGNAGLLYSAIVSNTINFRNNVTTKRDIEMAGWLNSTLSLTEKYIKDMFAFKSRFFKGLKEELEGEFSHYSDFGFGIAQLEIVDAGIFVKNNLEEIKSSLETMKSERKLDFVCLSAIDVLDGYNVFICIDADTRKVLEKVLGVTFNKDIARREGIIMRKEIIPLLRDYFTH